MRELLKEYIEAGRIKIAPFIHEELSKANALRNAPYERDEIDLDQEW